MIISSIASQKLATEDPDAQPGFVAPSTISLQMLEESGERAGKIRPTENDDFIGHGRK
jgi:hypothetical protein